MACNSRIQWVIQSQNMYLIWDNAYLNNESSHENGWKWSLDSWQSTGNATRKQYHKRLFSRTILQHMEVLPVWSKCFLVLIVYFHEYLKFQISCVQHVSWNQQCISWNGQSVWNEQSHRFYEQILYILFFVPYAMFKLSAPTCVNPERHISSLFCYTQ